MKIRANSMNNFNLFGGLVGMWHEKQVLYNRLILMFSPVLRTRMFNELEIFREL